MPAQASEGLSFVDHVGFNKRMASIIAGAYDGYRVLSIGSGMAVSSSSGNLVVTTGTTVNQDTVICSATPYQASDLRARWGMLLSQRDANQLVRIGLANKITGTQTCATATFSTTSTTNVDITFLDAGGNALTLFGSGDLTKKFSICASSNASATIAHQDVTIASVSGTTVSCTGTGFTASQTGSITVYGSAMLMMEFTGATATSANALNRSLGDGASSAVTVNTTASANVYNMTRTPDGYEGRQTTGSGTSSIGSLLSAFYSQVRNIFDDSVEVFFFYIVSNLGSAPSGTTTLTSGFFDVRCREPNETETDNDASTAEGQAAANASLATLVQNSAPLVNGRYPVTSIGTGYTGSATVTRAANTTVYTAGDVVGGVLTIANAGPSGGTILVNTVDLMQNLTAIPSGQTTFRLHLYTITPPSAIADNSPFALTVASGDTTGYCGYVDLGAPALSTGSTVPYATVSPPPLEITLAGGSTSLYGYLVTAGGFTPAANSETYRLRVASIAA